MQTWKKAGMLLCLAGALAGCQRQKADTGNVSVTEVTETESRFETDGETEDMESYFEVTAETENIDETKRSGTQMAETDSSARMIQIKANGNVITFALNDSTAARELYEQLPMTVENEDFSNNEKTFYPPEKLDVTNAPSTDGSVGTLAYYEPWGDVVLFYGSYNPNGSLYELGKVVSGGEMIGEISGEMEISGLE